MIFVKIILISSISFLALCNNTFAQTPGISWTKCLGGTEADDGECIIETDSNQYLMAGTSRSDDGDVTHNYGSVDIWLVKLKGSAIEWQKSFGGTDIDIASAVIPLNSAEKGYVVAGNTYSNDSDVKGSHGAEDGWILFLDDTGRIVGQRCLGGSKNDQINAIAPTSDGGYIVAGYTFSDDGDVSGLHDTAGGLQDAWVVKLSNTGTIMWQKCLGGSSDDEANSVQQTLDGGYIVAGYTNSSDGDVIGTHGGGDAWVVKLSSTGSIEWQHPFGGSDDEVAESILQTKDSGYIFTGYTFSNDGNVSGNHGSGKSSDVWVVKMNSKSTLQWQKCYGGTQNELGRHIEKTADNGFLVSGYADSKDGDVTGNKGMSNFWVLKIKDTGAIIWEKCMGGSNVDACNWGLQTRDSGYIFTGLTVSHDGDVTGNHDIYYGDCWVVKLGKDSVISAVVNNIPTRADIKVYPTVGNGLVYIDMPPGFEKADIKVYNSSGQAISFIQSGTGLLNRILKISYRAHDVFLVRILHNDSVFTYKVYR